MPLDFDKVMFFYEKVKKDQPVSEIERMRENENELMKKYSTVLTDFEKITVLAVPSKKLSMLVNSVAIPPQKNLNLLVTNKPNIGCIKVVNTIVTNALMKE